MDQRLREAAKLGFTEAWIPKSAGRRAQKSSAPSGVGLTVMGHVQDLVGKFA